jgi:D-glycero-D-manno-heptose 1,7-bisphosphate phosphatase
MANRAVLLDRDGIIDELVYYPEHGVADSPFMPSQFVLVEGIGAALRELKAAGYKLVLVSNQPGMAKKNLTKPTFKRIQAKMRNLLAAQGVKLDGEYYCFHHPQGKVARYRVACDCRKPKPGMLLKAAEELNLDLASSWMIGDSVTDVMAGSRAGCRTILVTNLNSTVAKMISQSGVEPDFVARNVTEAAAIVKKGAPEIRGQ